jgi:acyl-CoA thioester hydrolase
LRSKDSFVSKLCVQKSGARYVFHQAIYRTSDEALCAVGTMDTVVLVNGKLTAGIAELDALMS